MKTIFTAIVAYMQRLEEYVLVKLYAHVDGNDYEILNDFYLVFFW